MSASVVDYFRDALPGFDRAEAERQREAREDLARQALAGDEEAELELAALVEAEDREEDEWTT